MNRFSKSFSDRLEKLAYGGWLKSTPWDMQSKPVDPQTTPTLFEGSSTAGAFGQIMPPTDHDADKEDQKKSPTDNWLEFLRTDEKK